MTMRRMTRVNELIRREIAESLFRLMHESNFDLSAVTVTHVITSANLRHSRVYVSIRDHQGERAAMLSMLNHHRVELQGRINKNLGLKYTPKLSFVINPSLEKGNHVLDILNRIETTAPPPPSEDEPPGEVSLEDETPK